MTGVPYPIPRRVRPTSGSRWWLRGDRQSRKRRKRLRSGPFHDRRPVILDSTLTDAKIGGDVLAGMPGEDQIHDLMLPCREAGDVARRILTPRGSLAGIPPLVKRASDTGGQFLAAPRLFAEVRGPRLHGLDRDGHVAIAGDHDGRRQ